jgi:uncharacterized protein DUF2589
MAAKPLALEQLIGAPLRALVRGEEVATRATADFVSELGFETTPENKTVVRQVEFEYLHPVPDPANPGSIVPTPTRVRVPLLTMFPVPNLRIAEATVTFGANVVDVKAEKVSRAPTSLERTGATTSQTQLFAVYAPAVPPPGQPAPTFSVSIKVTKQAASEGLTRILNLLGDTITATPIKPTK